ncbi:MAG: hypothetical protein M9887_11925 [Chitinophagales bacterium]|nr:hypothetical protein [Chitinophagales bacterium]
MAQLDITLFKKDSPLFYLKVLLVTFYLLFYGSPVLSVTPLAPIYTIVTYVIVGILVPFAFIYLFDKIFIKKRFSTIDSLVVLMSLFVFYTALTSSAVFDQPILKGVFISMKTYLPIISIFLFYYLFKTETVTMNQYNIGMLMVCWVNLVLYIFLMFTINPAVFKDTTDMVGFNPSKGGYVFNFPPNFIVYGIFFYFIDYTINKNRFSLLLSFVLIAYILFLDKGRIQFVCIVGALALHTLWLLPLKSIMFRVFDIILVTVLMLLIVYWIEPELLDVVYNMFMVFAKAIFGIETGESSADARWVEIASVLSYFDKHPGQWFFGIGFIPRDEMWLRFGYLYFTDIGIFGVLLVFGIVGSVLLFLFFLYPAFVVRKIKNFKHDIIFNTIVGSVFYLLLTSVFTGGFAFAPASMLSIFMVLEYYKQKDDKIQQVKKWRAAQSLAA